MESQKAVWIRACGGRLRNFGSDARSRDDFKAEIETVRVKRAVRGSKKMGNSAMIGLLW